MGRVVKVLLIGVALGITGCAPTASTFSRTGQAQIVADSFEIIPLKDQSPEQMQADREVCMKQVAEPYFRLDPVTLFTPLGYLGWGHYWAEQKDFQRCMKPRGYRLEEKQK